MITLKVNGQDHTYDGDADGAPALGACATNSA